MYVPNAFREDNVETLVAFMRGHSFATLVSVLDGTPFASHIPVVVRQDGGAVRLLGHLARANPQWRAFGNGETLAIFTGPHAYVSPSLYEKRESVPTWDYIAVHAYGIPRILALEDSRQALEGMLEAMIESYDPSYRRQWDELSEKFREGMLTGIVGFEVTVTRLEGKFKLSQNRGIADQKSVAHSLLLNTDPTIYQVGEAMRKSLDTNGKV
jgi:transcriptional regulator